jgi:hypothetical protein
MPARLPAHSGEPRRWTQALRTGVIVDRYPRRPVHAVRTDAVRTGEPWGLLAPRIDRSAEAVLPSQLALRRSSLAMARIRLLPDTELNEQTAAALQAMEAAGQDTSTLRGLANAQELFDSYFQFYGPAREGRSIPAELIELVRLRIARHNDCFT